MLAVGLISVCTMEYHSEGPRQQHYSCDFTQGAPIYPLPHGREPIYLWPHAMGVSHQGCVLYPQPQAGYSLSLR